MLEVCRVDGNFLTGRSGWGCEIRLLGFDFEGAFDDGADEGLGVAVDCCYDGGRHGLGESLVRYLELVLKDLEGRVEYETELYTLRTVSFFSLTRRKAS